MRAGYSAAQAASKYDHAVALDLAHAAVVQQQVDVAEHLGERQVGLRDRDVAEQRLRELVAGARALGDQAVDLLRPPCGGTRSRSSISVTWSVIGSPCPESTISAGSSRVLRSDSR